MSHKAIPVRKEHQFDFGVLSAYINQHVPEFKTATGPEQHEVKQFNHGQSNPTFYIKYKGLEVVLRKKPPGKQLLPGAHAVDREFQIQSALYKQNFPVPRPIHYCSDPAIIGTDFYLMEYVEGRIFEDPNLPGLNPNEKRAIHEQMVEVLARLHRFDPGQVGLG